MSVGSKRKPRFRVGDKVSVVYGPQWVSGEVMEDRGPLGEFGRRLYRVRVRLIEEDELTLDVPEEDMNEDPQASAGGSARGPRQEFDVSYYRQDKANNWTAQIKRGKLYQGVKAKGAIAYTTGMREGARVGEENHASVSVFVVPEPHQAPDELAIEAGRLADKMFRRRHPNAVIEHDHAG